MNEKEAKEGIVQLTENISELAEIFRQWGVEVYVDGVFYPFRVLEASTQIIDELVAIKPISEEQREIRDRAVQRLTGAIRLTMSIVRNGFGSVSYRVGDKLEMRLD